MSKVKFDWDLANFEFYLHCANAAQFNVNGLLSQTNRLNSEFASQVAKHFKIGFDLINKAIADNVPDNIPQHE